MRDENENLFVSFELLFEPDARFQIQVIGGFVEQKQMRFDEQSSGKSNAHAPASGKVFALLVLHSCGEAQTLEEMAGLGLGRVRAQLIQSLVDLKQESFRNSSTNEFN